MKINLDPGSGTAYRIESYRGGECIVVNGQAYRHSVIVTPAQIEAWPPANFEELRAEHFALLLKFSPDCILFGSGSRFRFPAAELIISLTQQGIGVEVMDTGAACRTYSVLMAEGRQVAAALLI
jgi:uncharacterized protein